MDLTNPATAHEFLMNNSGYVRVGDEYPIIYEDDPWLHGDYDGDDEEDNVAEETGGSAAKDQKDEPGQESGDDRVPNSEQHRIIENPIETDASEQHITVSELEILKLQVASEKDRIASLEEANLELHKENESFECTVVRYEKKTHRKCRLFQIHQILNSRECDPCLCNEN